MATNPTPVTYRIYDIHSVLALCDNENFVEDFHDYLQNSDYSYGNNGDTLIEVKDFDKFFHEFCDHYSDVYPKGSINYDAVKKFFCQVWLETDTMPTFISLGC